MLHIPTGNQAERISFSIAWRTVSVSVLEATRDVGKTSRAHTHTDMCVNLVNAVHLTCVAIFVSFNVVVLLIRICFTSNGMIQN